MDDPRLEPSRAAQPLFDLVGGNPRPVFSCEPRWHRHIFTVDMDHIWHGADLGLGSAGAVGTQHLLLPAPGPGSSHSAHFDPLSPYFQAFFSLYVAPPIDGRRVPVEAGSVLGRLDNLAWQRFMGDPDPLTDLTEPCTIEPIAYGPQGEATAWFCRANYRIHADLGDRAPDEVLPPILRPPYDGWRDVVDSYHPMLMLGRAVLWYQGDHLMINFFNGVAFTTRDGRAINTYEDGPELRESCWRMAGGLRVLDTGEGFRPLPRRPGGLAY